MKKILLILQLILIQPAYSKNLEDSLDMLTYGYNRSDLNNYNTNINKIFNIELGQIVKDINGTTKDNFKIIDIDFKGFKQAIITYTPITEKVTTITTIKKIEYNCENEIEIISKIFEERYGRLQQINNFYYVQENDTTLIVQCNNYKNIIIMLDKASLNDLYKNEIIKIEIEKEKNKF